MFARRYWLWGAMLVLAVGGLLFMHGIDASGHAVAHDDHSSVGHGAHAPGEKNGHSMVVHVVSVCVAVLAAAGGIALGRTWPRLERVRVTSRATVRRRAERPPEREHPPGAHRLALCVLRI